MNQRPDFFNLEKIKDYPIPITDLRLCILNDKKNDTNILTNTRNYIKESPQNSVASLKVIELLIESLSYQDDDLRVDVKRGGRNSWEVLSDTRLNVSTYFEDRIVGFKQNTNWPTAGFRKLRFTTNANLTKGDIIKIWGVDVGGTLTMSKCKITIRYGDGTVTILNDVGDFTPNEYSPEGVGRFRFTPTGSNTWPLGTVGDPAELVKTSGQRPWDPGSPPIYVPHSVFIL